jgi:hypothetical protein
MPCDPGSPLGRLVLRQLLHLLGLHFDHPQSVTFGA